MAEIMAPVGGWESLAAALKAGADSVYFGVESLNMRARAAKRFTLSDLRKIVKICEKKNVKTYLTLNIILYDEDLALMHKICDKAKEAGVTAVIATDIAAITYAKSLGLEVHLSTQCNVSNIEAVKYYAQYAEVIVLARELKLEQIKKICTAIKKQKIRGPSGKLVEIEVFVHGALCVAIAGKCYMSLAQYNHSANRGDCLQACRRSYHVTDEETGDELNVENKFIMSPKDLCCIRFLDKILDAGVRVLKIEGRGRQPEYVYTVTNAYKEAVFAIEEKSFTSEKIKVWERQLETVFNRGFWHGGYYLGKKLGAWSGVYGSKALQQKQFVGIVQNYYTKNNVAVVAMQTGTLKEGDSILVLGTTTYAALVAEGLKVDDKDVKAANKGDVVSFVLHEKARKNDKVYIMIQQKI
jgi:U32 family peptidase